MNIRSAIKQEALAMDINRLTIKGTSMLKIIVIIVLIIASWSFAMQKNRGDYVNQPYQRASEVSSKPLVVVYSLTGNTEALAKEIAKKHNAELLYITAEAYEGGRGGTSAAYDAWFEKEKPIDPATVNLGQYDTVYLGSPIWWYRPAPPLWTFIKSNDFSSTDVILFNTFNSKFKQKNIDKFAAIVEANGGTFKDHIYIRRGRATPFQKNTQDVVNESKELLK
mgnify:CR=1 FL=1